MNSFKLIKRLLGLVKNFINIILLAVLNGVLGFLTSLSISIFAGIAILKYYNHDISLSYEIIILIMVLLGCFRGVLRYFEQYSNHFIAFKILAKIRSIIFKKMRDLSPAKILDFKKGDLINQITSDVETLEVFYAHTISPFLIAFVFNALIIAFLAIVIHPFFALLTLGFYIIVGLIIPIVFYKFSNKLGKEYRNDLALTNNLFLDSIQGRRDIRYNQNTSLFINKEESYTTKLEEKNKTLFKYQMVSKGIVDSIIFLGAVINILIGSLLIEKGMLEVEFLIFGIIIYLSSFSPSIALANLPSNLNQTFASAKRVFSLLDEEPKVTECISDVRLNYNKLEVANLKFKYDNKEILESVSFTLERGKIMGIKGKSGSGKSTILKNLMYFYPYQGSIKYDGVLVEEIDRKDFLKNVCLFSQTTYLFNDTIRNNLKIANLNKTDEEILAALDYVKMKDYILSLEKGLDTIIEENSTNLSLGQRQRIGLARVLLHEPKFLFLDEPTSNIDSLNEDFIIDVINSLKEKMAIIIISHKDEPLRIADEIYYMKDKKLCLS